MALRAGLHAEAPGARRLEPQRHRDTVAHREWWATKARRHEGAQRVKRKKRGGEKEERQLADLKMCQLVDGVRTGVGADRTKIFLIG